MRILVVGAGGTGGYFGGRLLQAGADVTFLVRAGRAASLARNGLVIRSARGDVDLPAPPVVTADALRENFDLILLSCKAYDLESAMDAFAAAVGPQTAILPLLNGMRHLDALDARFGAAHVLGGQCAISAALGSEGEILHLNDAHTLTFGERDGVRTARAEAIEAVFAKANFDTRHSSVILQEMWEKWIFIATLAGITCLMRAAIGDIVAAGNADLAAALFDECAVIAERNGFPPRAAMIERSRAMLTAAGSPFTASMLRDIERGGRIEADHVVGDLLDRGEPHRGGALLRIAYAHLKSYEARRTREAVVPA
ncbi:2-dehydropantoate 2-reductase [Acidiphilium sp. AL]|uniref:2-dehydropantoate 2-reductase n=1 Tax=Acidiphilium iwatense TaxID=768198 RepID=A0ABS9DY30_9PROT|nr:MULTISPECIES: 2-dehydropantoate 2-reductase [Acidiphilium]MCF3947593.1 2-dehydropantoate 2-reductase [Acidiphilium iwatense]MCU4160759.1 2-dehydropantoate 2-reductase [Acidiphilium sp. AL]